MSHTRTRLRLGASAVGATCLVLLGASAASAHVTISPDSAPANGYSVLTFSVGHGCDGSPTTKIAISLPQELNDATPTVNPNWDVARVTQKLDKPVKQENGSSITERTSSIVYTAKTPLDAHQRDTFQLQVKLPNDPGKQLNFPVLQTCEKGSTDWSQTLAKGAPEDSVDHPAPSVTLSSATSDSHTSGSNSNTAPTAQAAAATNSTDDSSRVVGWVGFGFGIVGMLLGAFALWRTRKAKA